MWKSLFFLFLSFGCSSVKNPSVATSDQTSFLVSQLQTNMQELGNNLRTLVLQMDTMQKMTKEQEISLASLQKEVFEERIKQYDSLEQKLVFLQNELLKIRGQKEEMEKTLSSLSLLVEEKMPTFQQTSQQLKEMELRLFMQEKVLQDKGILARQIEKEKLLHKVLPSDTWEQIASTYHVSVEELKKMNEIEMHSLQAGTLLIIPIAK